MAAVLRCLVRFRSQHKPVVAAVYAMDYERQRWIEAVRAHYVHSESFRSPMGGNIAAFVSRAAAELHGAVLRYDQLPEE